MCGILYYNSNSKLDTKVFAKALETLNHRGPDNSDYQSFNNNKVFLGHTRLKIIDLQNRANQPFISKCKRYSLIFNGEIYNFKNLKEKLNLNSSTSSDTEVLLECFLLFKEDFIKYIDGMYAGVIYDKLKKITYVFRDLNGIKPLLIYKNNNKIIVASEINPIKKLVNLKIDKKKINDYISLKKKNHSYDTFYENLTFFPKNTILIFDSKVENFKKIYNFNIKKFLTISKKKDFKNHLVNIKKKINEQLISDVPTAFNLSCGVDSLSALSLIDNKKNLYIQTGITNQTSKEDLLLIDNIQKFFNIEINKINLDDALNDDFNLKKIVINNQHPIQYQNLLHFFLSENLKKRGIKVVVDGEGGDEIFFGYGMYLSHYLNNISMFEKNNFLRLIGNIVNSISKNKLKKIILSNYNYKLFRNVLFKDMFYMSNSIECRPLFLTKGIWDIIYSNFNFNNMFGKLNEKVVSKYYLRYFLNDIQKNNNSKIFDRIIFGKKNTIIQPLKFSYLSNKIAQEINEYFKNKQISLVNKNFDEKFKLYQYHLLSNY
jgi:asparagine synthase (glutamine-hydrolysing)